MEHILTIAYLLNEISKGVIDFNLLHNYVKALTGHDEVRTTALAEALTALPIVVYFPNGFSKEDYLKVYNILKKNDLHAFLWHLNDEEFMIQMLTEILTTVQDIELEYIFNLYVVGNVTLFDEDDTNLDGSCAVY